MNRIRPADDAPPAAPVECHSGYTYADRPTVVRWQGQRLAVEAVLQSWHVPGGRRFRVRTEDGRVFDLSYGELYDEWQIRLP